MKAFKAIAAMSLNRVIGRGNQIPWHLAEDFRWFKSMTTGHIVVMGRKTFEAIGKALPGRETIVLTRTGFRQPGVRTISALTELDVAGERREVFICGGARVYAEALPRCSDLYLTLVKREVEGDAFFPEFEDRFELVERIRQTPEFDILHYRNRSGASTLAAHGRDH
jgi:dihydrofolate reductase